MTRRIVALSVHRTALIAAICGAVFALILALLFTPFMMIMPRMGTTSAFPPGISTLSGLMIIVMPLTYFVLGYILTALWVVVFNLIAPRIGGLPVTFAEEEPSATL